MFRVYLAGPIAGCTDDECKDWREMAKLKLPMVECIDPMRRDYRGREMKHLQDLVVLDKADIRMSDVVLVNHSKPSSGTAMEIYFAWRLGIPVIVVDNRLTEDVPISPWIYFHATRVFNHWSEAYHWIEQAYAEQP